MPDTERAQCSTGPDAPNPAVADALRPTPAYRDWSTRVREISRLPKRELVRRVREQGVSGDLERWGKDELVSTLCPSLPHEQMWERVLPGRLVEDALQPYTDNPQHAAIAVMNALRKAGLTVVRNVA